ncbi:MAG: thymidine kinase, partial [Desulfobacterales bacterium]
NYQERGMNTLIVKPRTDTKGEDQVISRLRVACRVDILAAADLNLFDAIAQRPRPQGKLHCVLVDEAQFLSVSQVDQLFEVAVIQGIPVICYGLRTDFRLEGFPGSARLLLLAHSIEELKTICQCGQKAVVNARKLNGRFVFEGRQVAIDGENHVAYESLCAQCYFKMKAPLTSDPGDES